MWMKFAGRYGKPSDNAGGASRASLRLFSAGVGELLTSTEYKLKQNTLKNFLIRLTHTHTHTQACCGGGRAAGLAGKITHLADAEVNELV